MLPNSLECRIFHDAAQITTTVAMRTACLLLRSEDLVRASSIGGSAQRGSCNLSLVQRLTSFRVSSYKEGLSSKRTTVNSL